MIKRPIYISSLPISSFVIVISENATDTEKYSATELQKYISKTNGSTLPVITDKSAPAAAEIIIGKTSRTESFPHLGEDSYRIEARKGQLILYGGNDRGTIYAVYSYLEKYIGWRFFASDCEIIREKAHCNIYAGEVFEDKPHFTLRDPLYIETRNPDLRVKQKLNADCIPNDGRSFIPHHMGYSVGSAYFCHSFPGLLPPAKYFAEHPEYYALRNGKRTTAQLCLSNPEVLEELTKNALETLRQNPRQIISISQHDNQDYCTCEKCMAIAEEEESQSGPLLRFVNKVAEAIEKEFPDVLVDTLAYQYTRKRPKYTKPRHNVTIRLCSIECCFRHPHYDPTCEVNTAFQRDIIEWGEVCDKLSIWDYVTNFGHFTTALPNINILREDVRFFAEHNAMHMLSQGQHTGVGADFAQLKCYLISKLHWNPYMSKEEFEYHMEDFLKGYYGPGWEYILDYIKLLDDVTMEQHHYIFEKPIDFVKYDEFYELCDKAIALCDTLSQEVRIRRLKQNVWYSDLCLHNEERRNKGEESLKALVQENKAYYNEFKKLGLRRSEWDDYTDNEDEIDFTMPPDHWKRITRPWKDPFKEVILP